MSGSLPDPAPSQPDFTGERFPTPEGMHFLVVAARDESALPADAPGISLFTDAEDSELNRAEANAREVLRLDGLLGEHDEAFARHGEHVRHLENLVVERERVIAERDAAVERHSAHIQHLERLVAERDQAIVERDRALVEANAMHDADRAKAAAIEKQMISLEVGRTRIESERTRLQAALDAQERAIAQLESFGGWLGWRWRRLSRGRDRRVP